MNEILFALWIFLPAGFANAAPVVAWKLPYLKKWNTPLDGARTFRGIRLFGANKTWRGLLSGILAAAFVFYIQQLIGPNLGFFSDYLDKAQYNQAPFWLGAALGFGALAGDAIESFVKRQLKIAPGKAWFPFDQLDYIAGAAIILIVFFPVPSITYIWIIVLYFVLHLAVSFVGYLLKFKRSPI